MTIRTALPEDTGILSENDRHVAPEELCSLIAAGRILIAEEDQRFIGWLRWNLFWDNIPFMNMLYLLDGCRKKGYGRELVLYWERLMFQKGYRLVMTSSLSNEEAQHFYRKLNYTDAGSLLLKDEPLEIIFTKEL